MPLSHKSKTKPTAAQQFAGLIGFLIIFGILWLFFGKWQDSETKKLMQETYNSVASDAIDRYRIVARQGSWADKCAQASMVAGSFLQAKDEQHYKEWKRIQDHDCRSAGVQ